MASQPQFGVLFSAGTASHLTCTIQHVSSTEGQGSQTAYKVLLVDAKGMRGWTTQFTVSELNSALQDEELDTADLDTALTRVMCCSDAVNCQLTPAGQLQLEAWCHRTQRVPMVPPTPEQRQPDSEYRQEAFCIKLPVTTDWMEAQEGQDFALINAGVMEFMLLRSQQQDARIASLVSFVQDLAQHAEDLHTLSYRAAKLLAKGLQQQGGDVKFNTTTSPRVQQQAAPPGPLLTSSQQQQQQQSGVGAGAGARTAAAEAAGQYSHLPVIPGASQLVGSQAAPGVLFVATQAAGSGGAGGSGAGSGAGSGGGHSSSRLAGASGGGKVHQGRQAQDDKAVKQILLEQQQQWQQWRELEQQRGQQPLQVQPQLPAARWQPPQPLQKQQQQQQQLQRQLPKVPSFGQPAGGAAAAGAFGQMDSSSAALQQMQGDAAAAAAAAAAATAGMAGDSSDGSHPGLGGQAGVDTRATQPMAAARTSQKRRRGMVAAGTSLLRR